MSWAKKMGICHFRVVNTWTLDFENLIAACSSVYEKVILSVVLTPFKNQINTFENAGWRPLSKCDKLLRHTVLWAIFLCKTLVCIMNAPLLRSYWKFNDYMFALLMLNRCWLHQQPSQNGSHWSARAVPVIHWKAGESCHNIHTAPTIFSRLSTPPALRRINSA